MAPSADAEDDTMESCEFKSLWRQSKSEEWSRAGADVVPGWMEQWTSFLSLGLRK